jgi:glutamine amidotransferase
MIGIVDYGMGNLLSVQKAFERVGLSARVVRTAAELVECERLVLPGVGAFGQAMENLTQRKLLASLQSAIAEGKPLLGICLGLQLLFERSEEHGNHEGLGLLRGDVRRLPPGVKVPHIGWNQLRIVRHNPLLEGIADDAFFYFVQSFCVRPEEEECVAGTTDYGVTFASVVARGRIFGVQFHPEKSQAAGLRLLSNFGRLSCS